MSLRILLLSLHIGELLLQRGRQVGLRWLGGAQETVARVSYILILTASSPISTAVDSRVRAITSAYVLVTQNLGLGLLPGLLSLRLSRLLVIASLMV